MNEVQAAESHKQRLCATPLVNHPIIAAFLTRYMGTDEANVARATGSIPNVGRNQQPRPTHFTRDEPTNNPRVAQQKYGLPHTPTHRAIVPEERVPDARIPESGPTTSGDGSQVITDEPVPVVPEEILPLDIPVEPIIMDPIP